MNQADILSGWIDAKTEYKEFIVDRKGKIKYYQTMNKEEFTDFGHFVGVMGKFNPHSIFFDPREVKALNFIFKTKIL